MRFLDFFSPQLIWLKRFLAFENFSAEKLGEKIENVLQISFELEV